MDTDKRHAREPAWILKGIRYLHRKGVIPRGAVFLTRRVAGGRPRRGSIVDVHMPYVGRLKVDLSDRGQCGYFLHLGLPRERLDVTLVLAGKPYLRNFIDIGAHIGYYTRLFAKLDSQAHVHSFEPSPEAFVLLRRNVADCANVQVNPVAVADSSGPRPFYSREASDLSSLLGGRRGSEHIVDCVSIDDYVERRQLARIDLVKCDIEGAEIFAIIGARRLLGAPAPPLWLVENNAATHWRRMGFTEGSLDQMMRDHSSQPLKFFYTEVTSTGIAVVDCNPRIHSWRRAGINIWIVPEHWEERFFAMVNAANGERGGGSLGLAVRSLRRRASAPRRLRGSANDE